MDQFMAQNATSLKAETCSKIAEKLAKIKQEISRVSNLLALVAPVDLNTQKATVVKKDNDNDNDKATAEKSNPVTSAPAVTAPSISDTIQRIKARQQ